MPIYLIDKIKQKNDGKFPLLDAKDVVMSDGKDVETAIKESGGGTATIDYATNEEVVALFGGSKIDELLGVWEFNSNINLNKDIGFKVDFTSNNTSFKTIQLNSGSLSTIQYEDTLGESKVVYKDNSWSLNFDTIKITDTSRLTNRQEFETWLKANAIKQNGGVLV